MHISSSLQNFYSLSCLSLLTRVRIDCPISSLNLFHIFLLRSYFDNNSSSSNPAKKKKKSSSWIFFCSRYEIVSIVRGKSTTRRRSKKLTRMQICWAVFILVFPFRINSTLFCIFWIFIYSHIQLFPLLSHKFPLHTQLYDINVIDTCDIHHVIS